MKKKDLKIIHAEEIESLESKLRQSEINFKQISTKHKKIYETNLFIRQENQKLNDQNQILRGRVNKIKVDMQIVINDNDSLMKQLKSNSDFYQEQTTEIYRLNCVAADLKEQVKYLLQKRDMMGLPPIELKEVKI
jgi:chromosome segregation ATPase